MEEDKAGKFLEYYLNPILDEAEDMDIQRMEEELKSAGIDVAGSEKRVRNLIKKAKMEIKFAKCKQFKRKFLVAGNTKAQITKVEEEKNEENILFLTQDEPDNSVLDDRNKMKMMEYLMKEVN